MRLSPTEGSKFPAIRRLRAVSPLILGLAAAAILLVIGAVAVSRFFASGEPILPFVVGPLWGWIVGLFLLTFVLGIVAVLAGVGGGVIFVPVLAAISPFHLDFVRGAGLLVALSGTIAAGPRLLSTGIASLRVGLPVGLITSAAAIAGAMIGLALPTRFVQVVLGLTVLGVFLIMLLAKNFEYPHVDYADAFSKALRINGIYREGSTGEEIQWKTHRTPQGFFVFVLVGFVAGMLGLGAGWANVPVLNLLMGVPLKVSVATSTFVISVSNTSAAWIYLHSGAMLPVLVVPSAVGMMLGSVVGSRMLTKMKPAVVRYVVLVVLLVAGVRALLQGLGI